jgi:hypothetical protein
MKDLRVLVCGSRDWAYDGPPRYKLAEPLCDYESLDAKLIRATLHWFTVDPDVLDLTVIEGGASGADSVAWKWAEALTDWGYAHYHHEHYRAQWELHGKAAGPIRNRQMLEEGRPDLVLAFTHDLDASRGTKNMVELARKNNIRTYVIG